jgi:hypothetical protein
MPDVSQPVPHVPEHVRVLRMLDTLRVPFIHRVFYGEPLHTSSKML